MVKKKDKIEKYIQIGEKKNGRFVKSEQYTFDEFNDLCESCLTEFEANKSNFIGRILGRQKRIDYEARIMNEAQSILKGNIMLLLFFLIEKDKKGKKVK